nr:immunoglobulin heavy chain junction region [Macaca mulatta]
CARQSVATTSSLSLW